MLLSLGAGPAGVGRTEQSDNRCAERIGKVHRATIVAQQA